MVALADGDYVCTGGYGVTGKQLVVRALLVVAGICYATEHPDIADFGGISAR